MSGPCVSLRLRNSRLVGKCFSPDSAALARGGTRGIIEGRAKKRIRSFGWNEVAMLVAALFALICVYGVIELAAEVKEGATQTVDEWVLRSLRRYDARAVPIGPSGLRETGFDLTAPAVTDLIHPGLALARPPLRSSPRINLQKLCDTAAT